MADQKLTQLTATASLVDADLMYVVDDVAGTPASKKATVETVKDHVLADAGLRENPLEHLDIVITGWMIAAVRTGAANFTFWYRNLGASKSISAIRLLIGTSSGNIAVALYADDGTDRRPGTRKATSGSVACPASGNADVSLGASAQADHADYLAVGTDNSTVTIGSASSFGTNATVLEGLRWQLAVFPPPDPAGGASLTMNRDHILRGI